MVIPIAMTRDALVAVLEDITDAVRAGDSFEGSLTYSMPTEEDDAVPEETYAMVCAVYRVGNRMGQGGSRVIGR